MKFVRSLAAVAVGYIVVLFIIRYFAPQPAEGMQYFLLSVTVVSAAALLGGLVTAFIASGRELAHAAGLGLLMIAMSLYSIFKAGEPAPGWSETATSACGPMAALLGAAVRQLFKPKARRAIS